MRWTRSARLASLFALVAAMGTAAVAAPADRIWRTAGGRPLVADAVLVEHYDVVSYKKGANELTIDGNKVRAVEYGDAPESFALAAGKRDAGEFENAVNLFKSAAAEGKVRPWIKVHVPYELGRTYLAWAAKDRAKYELAAKAFDEALAADGKTRLRPEILLSRARAHAGAGRLDAAIADLDTLGKEAYANKYGARWELRAALEKAQALEDAGRADDAKREYAKLETNARAFTGNAEVEAADKTFAAEVAGLARLAQGRVLIRDGKAAEAERFFDGIVRDANEVPAAQAAALVGKGEALQQQNRLKDAQLAYAQVRVRYPMASEAVAEATYRLGTVCEALGAAEPKGAKLAQDYYAEVAQRFADSRWARLAQEKAQ